MKATEFLASLPEQPTPEREQKILAAVRAGLALPITWMPVRTTYEGHLGTIFVAADALAIGESDDWVRVNVSHTTAQRIADALGAALPTPKISDAAYLQASIVLAPCLQTPDAQMGCTSRMVRAHRAIEAQREGRTGLIRNVGKDWVLTNRLVGQPDKAANYGWFTSQGEYQLGSGLRGWQPLGLAHDRAHVDYSQVLCLVRRDMLVDGATRDLNDVLRSPDLWGLVSEEGPLHLVRHPGVPEEPPAAILAPADAAPEALGLRALAVGAEELAAGVREEPMGSHAGRRIAEYFADCVRDFPRADGTVEGRKLGITTGNWCAAFVSFCAEHAAQACEAIPHAYRGSVAELWKDAQASATSRPASYRPRRGDLAIYARDGADPTKGGVGHVGRVSVEPDCQGSYETIEGNHMGAVARVKHTLGDAVGWIAYP